MTVAPGRDVALPDGWALHHDGRIDLNGASEIQPRPTEVK